MKEPNSSINVWAIARSLTFPATSKGSRQRSEWAEICRADLWTTEFGAHNTNRASGSHIFRTTNANALCGLDQLHPRRMRRRPVARTRASGSMTRNGDEYVRGLRDGRTVLMNGERVADVTTHPAFAAGIRTIAELYDLAHD